MVYVAPHLLFVTGEVGIVSATFVELEEYLEQ